MKVDGKRGWEVDALDYGGEVMTAQRHIIGFGVGHIAL